MQLTINLFNFIENNQESSQAEDGTKLNQSSRDEFENTMTTEGGSPLSFQHYRP